MESDEDNYSQENEGVESDDDQINDQINVVDS